MIKYSLKSCFMPSPSNQHFPLAFTAACVAMTSVTYGMGRYAYGLFLPSIGAQFDLTTFDLALIASLNAILYLVATIVASATAIHFRPRTFILLSGVTTTAGLLLAGMATSVAVATVGIVLAGIGAGILSPAMFEAIEAWLPAPWKPRAIGAVNAGAAPGIVLTGLAAYWLQSSWQQAWIVMAGIGLVVTLWHFWLIPTARLPRPASGVALPLGFSLFTRRACMPLYVSVFVYGLILSTYLTFAVDLVLSTGGMAFPMDRLFWVLLGLAGLPAMLTGAAVLRLGVRGLLAISMPACGLSYALLALAPGNQLVVLTSAILFGAASIAPGNGFLVWGISLFRERPSIGSGTVFVVLSIAIIIGPILFGIIATQICSQGFFLVMAVLSIVIIPLFPRAIFTTGRAGDQALLDNPTADF
ncbi:MFS transporter [Shinella sp.]|uniref:MFS transporter n=1 Tax=Shinella sp. TaxID=1870904 RepID=UPI004035218F